MCLCVYVCMCVCVYPTAYLTCPCVVSLSFRLHGGGLCGEYDARSDVYSLAVTLHIILTGETPLQHEVVDIRKLKCQEVRVYTFAHTNTHTRTCYAYLLFASEVLVYMAIPCFVYMLCVCVCVSCSCKPVLCFPTKSRL